MAKGAIKIDRESCKGCQLCATFCPKKVIFQLDKPNVNGYMPAAFKEHGECNGCGICYIVCPEVAIEVYRD